MPLIVEYQVDLNTPQHSLSTFSSCTLQDASILKDYNIYVVGDLHGNFVKLLSALIHLDFIQYRYDDELNKSRITNTILNLAEHILTHATWPRVHPFNLVNGPAVRDMIINKILNENFIVNKAQIAAGKKIVFVGDILCDRGPSDFVTLCVFDWMAEFNIDYRTICGNHDLDIWVLQRFSKVLIGEKHPEQHNSFDYFRTSISEWKTTFKKMYKRYLERMSLYCVVFENQNIEDRYYPLLLTHAPVSKQSFDSLTNHFKLCVPSVIKSDYINDSARINDFFRNLILNHPQLCTKQRNGKEWTPNENEFLTRTYVDFCFNRKFTIPFFENPPNTLKRYRILKKNANPMLPSLPLLSPSAQSKVVPIKKTPIFIRTYPHNTSVIRSEMNCGYNIFGHMSCARTDDDNVNIQSTQICLDSLTGIDPSISEGNVFYALIRGIPCW